MRAFFAEIPEYLLDERRTAGADRWDEMWDGVLHMPPMPGPEHQHLASGIEGWLRQFWLPSSTARIYREVNVAPPEGWPHDYRIPDLILLDRTRFRGVKSSHFEGPPLVVVEVHSPGDETYEKLDFYARLGVPEVWIIHRDTRKPTLFLLRRKEYAEQTPEDGWLVSPGTGIAMKARRPRKLCLQLGVDITTRGLLPE